VIVLLDDATVVAEGDPGAAGERHQLAAIGERRPPFDGGAVERRTTQALAAVSASTKRAYGFPQNSEPLTPS
jgi:hypothetical protein